MSEKDKPQVSSPEQEIPQRRDTSCYDVRVYIPYDENRKSSYPDYNKVCQGLIKWIKQRPYGSASDGEKATLIYKIKHLPPKYRRGIWDIILHEEDMKGENLREFSRLYRAIPIDRRAGE